MTTLFPTAFRASARKPLATAIAAALLVAATAVQAQSDDESAKVLDAVEVTAGKRIEDLRDVPIAISVISQSQLEDLNANQLSDYADFVPGLRVQNNGAPGLTSVSIRGIAALSSGTTVGTYVDGVPVGSSGLYQAATTLVLDLVPFDLERIEVLRGPQGTLYGASTMGGLLKYVSRKPDTAAASYRIGTGLGNMSGGGTNWDARVIANLPIQTDRAALSVGYARVHHAGFTDNDVNGAEDIDTGTQESTRVALYLDGETLDATLSAIRQVTDMEGRSGLAVDPTTREPLYGDLTDRLWTLPAFYKEVDLVSLTLNADLGWGELVSASGWSTADTRIGLDATIPFGEVANRLLGQPASGASAGLYSLDFEKFTKELRLQSSGEGDFQWMLGAFWTKESGNQQQFFDLTRLNRAPLPAPFDQIAGVLADLGMGSEYKETALFANANWTFTERFSIGAGVRQSSNDQTYTQNVSRGILVPLGITRGASDEDVFTWSLSPQFHFGETAMLYARIANGYQPGGPNAAVPGLPAMVDSSMLTSSELGLKADFADGRGFIDIAVFHIDWDNIQVPTSVGGVGGLVNGGEATSEGIEMAVNFRATDALRLGLNAAYTRAELKNDYTPVVVPQQGFTVEITSGLGGDRMPYVPKMAWSATAVYGFDLGQSWRARVGGAWRHVGERVTGTTSRQRVIAGGSIVQEVVTAPLDVASYGALDLYVGAANEHWDLRVFLNNATDERGYSSIGTVENQLTRVVAFLRGVPIQPRTLGLQVDYRF